MTQGELYKKSWTSNKVYWLQEMGSNEDELKNSDGNWVPIEVLDEAKKEFPHGPFFAPGVNRTCKLAEILTWYKKWFGDDQP